VILAGRRINDGTGKFIAEQTLKHMIRNGSLNEPFEMERALLSDHIPWVRDSCP
jgi:hypothetical protein